MRVLVAGDYCPKFELNDIINKGHYGRLFGEIKSISELSDFAIVNFETTIPTSESKKILKCGPNIKSVLKSIEALNYAGFNVVTLANNHSYDYGKDGLDNTIKNLREANIRYVGAGENLDEASKTLILEKGNIRVSIINCCEHEFSIATDNEGGANPLNPISQFYAIKEAKQKSDFVFVIVHGGHEHFQLPSPRMQETYRFFIDAGADVVINHHQHCFSGIEKYHGKTIFYGLGNFLFDTHNSSYTKKWYSGYFVVFDVECEAISYTLYPYEQCLRTQGVHLLRDKIQLDNFYSELSELNWIIQSPEELRKYYHDFLKKFRANDIITSLTPYDNRYLKAAYTRGLLPSMLSKRKLTHILNLIECESHCDSAKYIIRDKIIN